MYLSKYVYNPTTNQRLKSQNNRLVTSRPPEDFNYRRISFSDESSGEKQEENYDEFQAIVN